MPTTLKIAVPQSGSSYQITVGSGVLADAGRRVRRVLGKTAQRVCIVSNKKVAGLYAEVLSASLREQGFEVSAFLMPDGERYKTLATAERALAAFSKAGLVRGDGIVALGGGVVGDLTGFAASVYLRGMPFVQVPTTLLAMVDSSVGGKTGVNAPFGKNMLGAFHHPATVIADVATLETLERREMTAGLCEMVKHAAISGPDLMRETVDHLQAPGPASLARLIDSNIAYKAEIVSGDPLEDPARRDPRSRKVLNFGHTLAHALEKVTDYRNFRHGEAVGYGILFAAELSKSLALIPEKDVKLLNDVVHRVGNLPSLAHIEADELLNAFRFDKKNVGGSLQMVLLRGIGRPVVFDTKGVPMQTFRSVLEKLLSHRR